MAENQLFPQLSKAEIEKRLEESRKLPGLLYQFISTKAEGYQREPERTRAGTPRGELIGFSTKKYEASLWMLTSFNKKEIAGLVGQKYNMVRHWIHEKEFQEKIGQHMEEFFRVFIKRVHERVESKPYWNMASVLANTPIEKVAEIDPTAPQTNKKYEEFGDVELYGPNLLIHLLDAIAKDLERSIKEGNANRDLLLSVEYDKIIWAMNRFSQHVKIKRGRKDLLNQTQVLLARIDSINKKSRPIRQKRLALIVLATARNALINPASEEKTRKWAIFSLGLIERQLKEEIEREGKGTEIRLTIPQVLEEGG